MEREAERQAFAKAWSYLNYSAGAKWCAILAAIGTGLLYIALLILLWLFADLMAERGQIPAFRDLSPQQQRTWAEQWSDLSEEEEKRLLQWLRDSDLLRTTRAAALAEADAPQGLTRERELLWRAQLFQILRTRVNGTAAASVLPAYRELPDRQQDAIAEWWDNADTPDAIRLLEAVDISADEAGDLAKKDWSQLTPQGHELVWRARLYQVFEGRQTRTDDDIANSLRGNRSRGLSNRGILSLVVRTEVRSRTANGWWEKASPQGLFSAVTGWLARWNAWWMWKNGNSAFLAGLLILAVLVTLLRGLLTYVMHDMAARAVIEASTRLRRAVYHHTFRLGMLAIKALGPSEAVTVFTRHVEAVADALYARLTVNFREPVKFGLLLAFVLIMPALESLANILLVLAFLVLAVLVWLVGGQIAAHFRQQGRLATNRASEQLTLIRESLMLLRLVKVYLMELFNQSRVERQLARYADAQQTRLRGEAIYGPLLIFLGLLAAVILLYVAGLVVLREQLSVASAITLATALVSLYWPLTKWLENRRILRRGRESAVQVFRFLDRPGGVGQVVGAQFLQPMGKQLEFDNVSVREPGTTRLLLQDVTLTIAAGQKVGLIGPEDLEKYALVYLIPRFLDPTAGEIRIDEHNLRWVTLDSLRGQIALVMQHNLVFHDTVANNIRCGDPAFTLPQIIDAAKMAHAHHFIQKLPKGYETPIGELGHSLSTGQQFLIALARAILRDPALLIVEEPTTPLDEDTKSALDDTFTRLLPGRTVIFLPHRISTIKSCDQIFLLHRGRVEAAGPHRELLKQSDFYKYLHFIEFSEMAEQV